MTQIFLTFLLLLFFVHNRPRLPFSMLEAKAFSQLSGLKYHQSPSLKGSAEEERSIGWPHQQKYSKNKCFGYVVRSDGMDVTCSGPKLEGIKQLIVALCDCLVIFVGLG